MRRRNLLIGVGALGLCGLGWRLSTGSRAGYAEAAALARVQPAPKAGMVDLIRIAALAPSGHNVQPWRFRLGRGVVAIEPDAARRTPAVDPDDHHLHVSLGAAAETLAVAGPAFGRPGAVTASPDGSLRYDFTEAPTRLPSAVLTILRRQSVRADYSGVAPPPVDLDALAKAARLPGVRIVLITDRPRLDRLAELSAEGAARQFGDAAFRDELLSWMRFNPRAALATGDGLFAGAVGAPVVPQFLGRLLFRGFATANQESARVRAQMAATPLAAVFFAEDPSPRGWAQVGRALTRLTLAGTERGLVSAHVNQAVEVEALRPELAALAGEPGLRPDLVLRLGYGPAMPYSPRRPLTRILA